MPKEPKDKALPPEALRAARAALAQARGRKRLDLLLEARDPQSLVRSLPADELYLTIREVGLGDLFDEVAAATDPTAGADPAIADADVLRERIQRIDAAMDELERRIDETAG